MSFKATQPQFQMLDINLIEPDPAHPRQHFDENALKSLAGSIEKKGLIQPLIVQPANAAGRHTLIVGERRWRAAQIAGETVVPALIRPCAAAEALEVQVFENLGLGMRAALEARDMATAIQTIAERFESKEAAAEHFGRSPTWLTQATAAANISPKITALLDAGKIASTGTAVRLEKLAQKNEARAETLISQTAQLPEGESLAKRVVERALSEEGGRRKKKANEEKEAIPAATSAATPAAVPQQAAATTEAVTAASSSDLAPWEDAPVASRQAFNPGKMQKVARILGLADGNEEEVLARLIDEFLALKGEAGEPQ
jgi:ParB family chromosome partitioning protein